MKIFKRVALLTIISTAFLSVAVYAATQGTLGATSTGSTDISLTIPDLVKISALNNIVLTPTTIPTAGLDGYTDACIYSNNGGNYAVTVTGSGTGGVFTVTDGSATVAYKAYWNDELGVSKNVELSPGAKQSGQTGASITSVTCNGGANLNATFLINFPEDAIAAAPASAPGVPYLGTATIVISPS